MPATMSIRGLYSIHNAIFNRMVLPDGMTSHDRDIIVQNIINEYAELEILYPDPIFMENAISTWSMKEVPTWQRVYNLAMKEYNPIENYNRTELTSESGENSRQQNTSGSEAHSGTDTSNTRSTTAVTGTDKDTNSGTDTVASKKAAFDSTTLVDTASDTTTHGHVLTKVINENTIESGNASVTHGESVNTSQGTTESGNNSVTRESHISGNIGVTTSQQMAEQELLVSPKLNVYNYIMNSFKNRFCLEIW